MSRLQVELHRLYAAPARDGADQEPGESSLIDAHGKVRAMVLELARPADWDALSKVWQGVQGDLELPAPAIAVSGKDGYQLWFSLAEPVPAEQANAFLESLRVRYLSDIKPQRMTLMPTVNPASPDQVLHAHWVPALRTESGFWSAFVAPDLAPVFADEPWLDQAPNLDGQSTLLSRLQSIRPADFQLALERLRLERPWAQPAPAPDSAAMADAAFGPTSAVAAAPGPALDPKRFLLDVMNNENLALALRIEAAKALLPYFGDSGGDGPQGAPLR